MGLDASITRHNKKFNSYKDMECFYDIMNDEDWAMKLISRCTEEIIYISDWCFVEPFSDIKEKHNYNINFEEGEELLLTKEDLIYIKEWIKNINFLEYYTKESKYLLDKQKEYLYKLDKCINETDFDNQTITFGMWY